MRLAFLLVCAAIPLPALAQSMPPECTVQRQCVEDNCTDNPGTTLMFQDTAGGIVTWDTSVPEERITLTSLPDGGAPTWVGRSPDLAASVLLTLLTGGEAVISMHMDHPTTPIFSAYLTCGTVQPPQSKGN